MGERLSLKIGPAALVLGAAGLGASLLVDLAVFGLRGRDPKIAAIVALGVGLAGGLVMAAQLLHALWRDEP